MISKGKYFKESIFFPLIKMGYEISQEKWKYPSHVGDFLHLEFLIL